MAELIKTAADLQRWLDDVGKRHAEQPDGSCSCGWTPGMGVVWEDHAAGGPIHDLGNVIGSRTLEGGEPVSYSDLESQLYDTIDRLHGALDDAEYLAAKGQDDGVRMVVYDAFRKAMERAFPTEVQPTDA